MKISKLFEESKNYLDKTSFNELIIYVTKKNNFLMIDEVDKKQSKLFWDCIKKIKAGSPLAYVTRNKYFFKNEFYVDERVLIPRFETELLVEEATTLDLKNKTVLDLCCGSGCIGISLKLFEPTIRLYLCDISLSALEITKKNLDKHRVNAKIIQADFLEVFKFIKEDIDVLLINPPYICRSDLNINSIVNNTEPHLALFAPNSGLYFYEQLFSEIDNLKLSKNIKIICEFGFQQKEAIKILHKKFVKNFSIKFKKDYNNNPRYFIMSGVR